jgi:AhpD family alkylhydroperoxidase
MIPSHLTPHRQLLLAAIAITLTLIVGIDRLALAETDAGHCDLPKPIPRTRPEMKQLLEALKSRKPRLPLPATPAPTLGEHTATTTLPSGQPRRSLVNNSRMRSHYLPESWHARTFRSDPNMTVDYALKTRLFWIVSRLNNCHYCLGHQEHKLLAAGMSEDEIAALDSRWAAFPASEQVAMEVARKLTIGPALVDDSDFERLRAHWNDQQIIEILHSVASNNATNRWTDALGIPQDLVFRDHPLSLDTATSPEFMTCESSVLASQPALPITRLELDTFRRELNEESFVPRTSRVPIQVTNAPERPAWLAALAPFPETAESMKQQWEAVANVGQLSTQIKWELRWVVARELQAKYAMSVAWQALRAEGLSWDDLSALDEGQPAGEAGDAVARRFAKKLTLTPQQMTDADIAELQKHFTDQEVAETVYVVCQANWFARFTEALHLPLER